MAKQLEYFVHHVYFWFSKPPSKEERERFEESLRKLVTIETIVEMHLGVPATTRREVVDRSYTYSLVATFRSKEDHDIYQTHPTHLRFIEECGDLWEKVVVYDSVSIEGKKPVLPC
jgi:hypothetical protein